MKSWLPKISNLVFIVALSFLLYRQVPVYMKNYRKTEVKILSSVYEVLSPNPKALTTVFPPANEKALGVFWATWCGPCLMEMKRLKSSVSEGKIDPASVYAINPFESAEIVRKFLKTNPYPFTFIDAPEVAAQLEVELTPTTVLVENNLVRSVSSGMSVIGIVKAENFLQNTPN